MDLRVRNLSKPLQNELENIKKHLGMKFDERSKMYSVVVEHLISNYCSDQKKIKELTDTVSSLTFQVGRLQAIDDNRKMIINDGIYNAKMFLSKMEGLKKHFEKKKAAKTVRKKAAKKKPVKKKAKKK